MSTEAGREYSGDGKFILLIGSGSQNWREYILKQLAPHYRLHLFTPAPPTWQANYITGHSIVDTLDADEMIRVARALPEKVDGVLGYEETRVEAAAAVATALGVRTSPVDAIRRCRDKFAGREAMRIAGVPQPRSIAVGSLAEAQVAVAQIGYPVVVKPRALSASVGVTLVSGPADLADGYEEADRIWFERLPNYDRQILVEEYLDGPEISVDAVCRDGEVTLLYLARKQLGYAPGFEEVAHAVDANDLLLGDAELQEVLQNAHQAVGLTDTMTHTELRLTDSGPKIVEINARIGGGRIPFIGGLANGILVGEVAAALVTGAEAKTTATTTAVAAVRFLYPERDTVAESVEVDESALPPEVCEVRVLADRGKRLLLPPRDYARCRYALIVAVSGDAERCAKALDEAAPAVRLYGTPILWVLTARMHDMTKSIAIVSGGMDSVAMAYKLKQQGGELILLSIDYGQRNRKELEFAAIAGKRLNADHVVADLSEVGKLLRGSSLTDPDVDVPEQTWSGYGESPNIVPNRNAVLLSVAFAVAVAERAETVAIGVTADDPNSVPDSTPAFLRSFIDMERLATAGYAHPGLDLAAPLSGLTKGGVVELGESLGVPWGETWTCLRGGAAHCSRCAACWERQEAFTQAGVPDPTVYLGQRS